MRTHQAVVIVALATACGSAKRARCERIAFAELNDPNIDKGLLERLIEGLDKLPEKTGLKHRLAGDTIPPRPSELAWYNEHCWGFERRP